MKKKSSLKEGNTLIVIDYFRWANIAFDTLLYSTLLYNIPPHSHSIVPGGFDVTS